MTTFTIIADAPSTVYVQAKNLIVLDGYAEKIRESNIVPDVIIGDFDAISEDTISYFKAKGCNVIHDSCQDSTDLDKGIKYCDAHGATEIVIYNAIGGRLDHTLYNTRILSKYYNVGRRIKLVNGSEIMEFFKDCELEVNGDINSPIAIMSAPKALVTSNGLKYELKAHSLEFGVSESSCNTLIATNTKLSINGCIFIIYNNNCALQPFLKKRT